MKAQKAIQQKMYRENSWSWGDGKQSLEELRKSFKLTFFDWFVANGSGESGLEQ